MSKECEEKVNCTICRDKNLSSDHRMGGNACTKKGTRGVAINQWLVKESRVACGLPRHGDREALWKFVHTQWWDAPSSPKRGEEKTRRGRK